MNGTATVVIPTIGRASLRQSIASVLEQTISGIYVYVVCDGPQYAPGVSALIAEFAAMRDRIRYLVLPDNVGSGGHYGHRIYAGCSHFVNTDYVLFLDEDNWFERDHVATLMAKITRSGLDWAYSLRRICSEHGRFVTNDDCESLGNWQGWQGYNLVDTSAYCIKSKVAAAVASAWHGGWGQDRIYLATLRRHFPRCGTSGLYTLNYRLGGNPQSVKEEFFLEGNQVMIQRHAGRLPWSPASPSAPEPRPSAP